MSSIEKLVSSGALTARELAGLIASRSQETAAHLAEAARAARDRFYGKRVFFRGIVEFTNICKNNCLYCGIRSGNSRANRYRLSAEEILQCCADGYAAGVRTFVLQGGEDPYFTDERLIPVIREIRETYPDCAVTLSLGERDPDSYRKLREAGADRYLLREETASPELYAKLHPPEMDCAHRKACLWELKKAGYAVGGGFLVGAPFQTVSNLAEDLIFLKELQPQMVGIGPFLPHRDTPFAEFPAGGLEQTLRMISITRLLLPHALIPATTALETLDPRGRTLGLLAGANVIMMNISPEQKKADYLLYDHKAGIHSGIAESVRIIREETDLAGMDLVTGRGDPLDAAPVTP